VKIDPAARILAAYKRKHVFEKCISFEVKKDCI
jgi:hypothetical protein